MANTQNNSQARKDKEKAGRLCQWLAILVKPFCWLWQWLVILVKPFCWLWQWLNKYLDQWLIFIIIILIIVFLVIASFDPVLVQLFGIAEKDVALEWAKRLLDTNSKGGTLTFIGLGIGGLALWQRAVSAGQQAKAMAGQAKAMAGQAKAMAGQAKAMIEQARAMVGETKQTRSGHTQERLKTSIDHLGNNKTSVRIGAAYELYHLAKDNEDYRETVCDILCGHVRQKTQDKKYQRKHENRPSEEIKTFLKLLKAFLELPRGEEKGPSRKRQVDLSSSFLRGADLSEAQLQGANLKGAYLREADLSEAQLQEVNLSNTQLREADLSNAQLQGADLKRAYLQGADLSNAQLQKAGLLEAQLQEVNLSNAQLQEADLLWAQLQGADLKGVHLQGANVLSADLQGAWLSEANLQGADLSEAKLQGANLSKAQLQGANLSKAQLQGANLSKANLQGVNSFGELPEMSFQDRVRARIGQGSDFTNVVFSGGLNADQVEEIIASMPAGLEDEIKEEMKNRLNEHVDKEAVHKLPDDSGAITGAYNKDEAKEWITDYEKSTSYQSAKDK